MPIGRIRLRSGVTVQQALDALRSLLVAGDNVLSAGTQPYEYQQAYVRWVDDVERQLISVSRNPLIVQTLHTSRYWQIRDIHARTAMPYDLVSSELRVQKEALERASSDLETRARALSKAPGKVAVLDCNVLLQYQPPPHVAWLELFKVDQVRLILPLRVVEELDAKKYSSNRRLQKAARALLLWLERTLGEGGRPGPVREGVTIEVPVENELRQRPPDADGEILAFCDEFGALTGTSPTLVTADTAMLIRAQAQGLAVCHPPDRYLRTTED